MNPEELGNAMFGIITSIYTVPAILSRTDFLKYVHTYMHAYMHTFMHKYLYV